MKFCNYCKKNGHIIKECPTRPQSFTNLTPIQQNAPTTSPTLNLEMYSLLWDSHVNPLHLGTSILGLPTITNNAQFLTRSTLGKDNREGINYAIVDYQMGHKCLGHPNLNVLHDMLKSGFHGNKHTPFLNIHFDCIPCKLGKSKILCFPTHHLNVTQPFDITHIISLGFIFYTQNMKCFPLSNSFMLKFKFNSLPKSKFVTLIVEGKTHRTHLRNSCNPMGLMCYHTIYVKPFPLQFIL
ncbi:hypothetical protein CR513_57003, partial [Mucuna pruriens]